MNADEQATAQDARARDKNRLDAQKRKRPALQLGIKLPATLARQRKIEEKKTFCRFAPRVMLHPTKKRSTQNVAKDAEKNH